MNYQDINAETIDRWVESGWEWGIPISHEIYEKALEGTWDVFLSPTRPVPHEWFGAGLRGKKLLGLASGGGQQMPIFSALGAECTVFDYSKKQLESERMLADREGYEILILRGDMSKPLPFEDESFDIIFHPVSNCYVREVLPIWKECFRILKKGGILLSGLDNGMNFIVDETQTSIVTPLPFDPLESGRDGEPVLVDGGAVEFSHTFDEQIRGQLQAGFRLSDVYEDTNGAGRLHEMGIPSFWVTRAVKD